MINRRIQWIDFVRGLSMAYIVSLHTGGFLNYQGAYITYMAVFFLLSGLLFNDKKPTKEIIISRINSLLVPFVLYYLIGCFAYYSLNIVFPDYVTYSFYKGDVYRAQGIQDVFVRRQYFNGPIWFILCLFWCELYFVLIVKYLNRLLQPVAVFGLGVVGWLLGSHRVFLPMMVDVGMTVLPVFYCGFLLRKIDYLNRTITAYSVVFFLLSSVLATLIIHLFNPGIHLHYNTPHGNPILVFVLAIASSFAVLQGARILYALIEKMRVKDRKIVVFPILQYIGQYSLILLGFHHLIYRPLVVLGIPPGNILFIATLVLNIALIPAVNKFFPALGGKVQVFRYKYYPR